MPYMRIAVKTKTCSKRVETSGESEGARDDRPGAKRRPGLLVLSELVLTFHDAGVACSARAAACERPEDVSVAEAEVSVQQGQ